MLNSGADINFKTGDFEISDLHRACGWGTVSFAKLLLKCDGDVNSTDIYGKSPFIFAIDFQTSSNCLDLMDSLVKHGASINHQDISGLSALHYASIRGKLDVVEKLVKLNANLYCMNSINYSPLTYSLCYISFMQYIETEAYNHRLKIVKLLINAVDNKSRLKQCIIGKETLPNLVALFNFIFYGLSQGLEYIEQIGWIFYHEILFKISNTASRSIDDQLFTIAQYLIMYNQNIFYFNYFVQRVQLTRINDFLFFHLVNVYNGKKNYLRINLLILYSIMSDNGDALKYVINNNFETNSPTPSLVDLNDVESTTNFNVSDRNDKNAISDVLSAIIKVRMKKPFSLKCLSRRVFRSTCKHTVLCVVNQLNIPLSLKRYLLYEELNDYVQCNDLSIKFMLKTVSKL